MTLDERFKRLVADAERLLPTVKTTEELDHLEKDVLGRKGELAQLLKGLTTVPQNDRPKLGSLANTAKSRLTTMFRERRRSLGAGESRPTFDPTLPGKIVRRGRLHPMTQTIRRIVGIFRSMGFEVVEGPEVELERYNFDLLNIPPDHPARDLQDTFYVSGGRNRVLRTHTSPVQLRSMESRRPPVRLIVPGRAYRHEATDASHEAAFFQCEGLVIDHGVRLTDLFGTIDVFLKAFFGSDVTTRAQVSYFPFVEPGAEIAMSCLLCRGSGCSVCKRTGWLEMMGCGMVHPTVLKNMKVDPKRYSGFAFGMGIDRLMALLYRVPDVRLAYSGDPRFLEQF